MPTYVRNVRLTMFDETDPWLIPRTYRLRGEDAEGCSIVEVLTVPDYYWETSPRSRGAILCRNAPARSEGQYAMVRFFGLGEA